METDREVAIPYTISEDVAVRSSGEARRSRLSGLNETAVTVLPQLSERRAFLDLQMV